MKPEYQNWQVETATSSRSDEIEYFIRRDGDSVAVASDIINPETEQPSKEIADMLCAAPDLLDALKVQHECGMPEKSLLYYEEWVEGWRWVHPDGREWEVVGDWCRPMPYHPIVAAAIAKAEGKA